MTGNGRFRPIALQHHGVLRLNMLNGGNRPDPAIRGQDVNGRFLVLHCGAMVLEVGHQLGKLRIYLRPLHGCWGFLCMHLSVGRVLASKR
jgi:hypothetical protein